MTQPTTSRSDADLDASLAAEPRKPEKSSLLDDFMDIFYAPSAVFARRANRDFWVPLLIITLLQAAIFFANRDLIDPIMEAEFARAMANSQQASSMTPDQVAAAAKIASKFGMVGAFFTTPLTILIVGIIIWLVAKFVDAKQTLNAAMVVSTFAFVPRIIEGILTRVQGLYVDPSTLTHRYSLSIGVGRLLDPDTTSPILFGFLGRIELFLLWSTVLIAIGIATTGKVSRTRGAIAAAVVWVLGALPVLAGALRR